MNYEQLRDWKNHYRGLISNYQSKLVEIRGWVERNRYEGELPWMMVPLREWAILEELVKREFISLPEKEVVAYDQAVDTGLIQMSLLKETE